MEDLYPAETTSGVVTSFIPLTSVFTPTAECTSYFRLNGPSLVAFDPGYGLDIDTNVRCLPSAVTTWWEQGRFGDAGDGDHTAVSIGPLTCPNEWSTVASSVKDGSSTLAMCCPSGYSLNNGIPGSVVGDCLSDVSSGMTLTFASTSPDNSESWSTATTTLTQDLYVGAIAVVGWNTLRDSSTTSLSSTYSHTSSPATTSEPIIQTSLVMSPRPDSTSSEASGISTGAAAGIGIGAGLSVIGIISLLTAMWLMRRRKQKAMAMAVGQATDPRDYYSALYQNTEPRQFHELSPRGGKSQLLTRSPPIELEGLPPYVRQHPAELYGG
ncbi:hypothetical protein F5X99DRAFT_393968 [Biscogniauxia marginata]|nr:hypothetical protein F5X99DRAFT_393968 [Biscogniauxia marginata]